LNKKHNIQNKNAKRAVLSDFFNTRQGNIPTRTQKPVKRQKIHPKRHNTKSASTSETNTSIKKQKSTSKSQKK